jgi:hypothetical protein
MSPTARTLKHLKARGCIADVAERWIAIPGHPGGGKRRDLFGFIDIVCVGAWIEGIQCTSAANAANRVTKIKTECREAATDWLQAGGRISVWGWRKYKKRLDGRYWRPRIVELTLDDLDPDGPD